MSIYGNPEKNLSHYTCLRTNQNIIVDGDLNKPIWQKAEKSSRFVDMVTGEPALLDTKMACIWNEDALYVGFWVQEPQVRATLTKRDSFIWFDNDVEVFIAGEDCYYEFEINAFNTVYEVFFIYQDAMRKPNNRFLPEFDLYKREVDVLSGFQDPSRYGKHHRGKRWAIMDFDLEGLTTAVQVQGKINDPSIIDSGWQVEVKFPWKGLRPLFSKNVFPPKNGDTLRMDFSRFEALRYHGKTVTESPGWSHSPHGVYDSHIPESFSFVHFSDTLID